MVGVPARVGVLQRVCAVHSGLVLTLSETQRLAALVGGQAVLLCGDRGEQVFTVNPLPRPGPLIDPPKAV